jgi:hypothetical protein
MITRSKLTAFVALVAAAVFVSCVPAEGTRQPRSTLVIGIDVSGSFRVTGNYDDAIDFAAHYLYGHLTGLGELRVPSAVFVGSIGGVRVGEPKSFQPIHAFQDKTVPEIASQLRELFPPEDSFTDFNAFFGRVATLVKRQGLVLAPLSVVVLSDGIPDATAATRRDTVSAFARIDVGPLEYLSRNVTVRLLYASPTASVAWERDIERRRVRMWTVDDQVMVGWREQVESEVPVQAQEELWGWIRDNVDFRVRSKRL